MARPFSRTGLILVAVLSAALATGIAVAIVKNVSQRGAVATAMTGGDARLAPGIFRRYGCTGCHAIPGVAGADGKVGANYVHFASGSISVTASTTHRTT